MRKIEYNAFDSYGRAVSSYVFKDMRAIHINGARKW